MVNSPSKPDARRGLTRSRVVALSSRRRRRGSGEPAGSAVAADVGDAGGGGVSESEGGAGCGGDSQAAMTCKVSWLLPLRPWTGSTC